MNKLISNKQRGHLMTLLKQEKQRRICFLFHARHFQSAFGRRLNEFCSLWLLHTNKFFTEGFLIYRAAKNMKDFK